MYKDSKLGTVIFLNRLDLRTGLLLEKEIDFQVVSADNIRAWRTAVAIQTECVRDEGSQRHGICG